MKRNALRVLLGLALVWVGCIPSLHPLYTDQDLIFDPQLVGLWAEDNSQETWRYESEGDKAYKLTYTETDGKKGEFKAHLLKLGQWRFLDLFPDEAGLKEARRNDYYNSHYIPAHTFIKVVQITPTLQLSVMETDWLDELLKKEPHAIRHEKAGDRFVLTASTKELQSFILKHVQTEAAWGKPSKLKRIETAAPGSRP